MSYSFTRIIRRIGLLSFGRQDLPVAILFSPSLFFSWDHFEENILVGGSFGNGGKRDVPLLLCTETLFAEPTSQQGHFADRSPPFTPMCKRVLSVHQLHVYPPMNCYYSTRDYGKNKSSDHQDKYVSFGT